MNMNLSTLIVGILGSGTTTAIILYFGKIIFEKLLDRRFAESEARTNASVAELTRRQARLFDSQFDSLKRLVETAYRLRNCSRGLIEASSADFLSNEDSIQKKAHLTFDQMRLLEECIKAVVDIIYQDRALFTGMIYQHAHAMKYSAEDFRNTFKVLWFSEESENLPRDKKRDMIGKLHEYYREINDAHLELVHEAQVLIGIQEPEEDQRRKSPRELGEDWLRSRWG